MADTGNDGARVHKTAFGRIGLVALALGFVLVTALVNVVFRGVRVDLTENRLYTLSEGTQNILGSIPEPVHLYLFFSDKATADVPYVRTYAGRVREMLMEFASRSDGKLRLTVIDPLPFSEEEDRAAGFGVRAVNSGNGGDPIYLGLAGTNSVGDDEVIPFLDPSKEAFLEYDLAKLVYTLANPKKPVVALLTSLPMMAGFDPMTQQVRQPWIVAEQLRQLFDLRMLEPSMEAIEDDVKVLMVVHPKNLPDTALYAIDQFVLRGGRALFFVDPLAEIDPGESMDPSAGSPSRSSSLDRLLRPWGVAIDDANVVGDDRYALMVGGMDGRPVRHLGIIGVDAEGISDDDVITAGFDRLNFAFPGRISRTKDGPTELEPLVQSSDQAGLLPVEGLSVMTSPDMLRADFSPTGERYTLAARITGEVPSAFPDGLPAPPGTPAGEKTAHLPKSSGPVNIVVVADADMLADRLWVQNQPSLFGEQVPAAFANNGDLVINALDNLLGSGDLISIRSRATFQRPFTRVQALRRAAEARFRTAEQTLQDELRMADEKLSELQASRTDQSAQILSPAQQAEIERFQKRRLELRQELRQVQRGLDRDIERLGTVLKLINIALVPALISVASLILVGVARRRRSRRAGASTRKAAA